MREELKLEYQLCFRVHRLSRLFIKLYQNALQQFGITYPQYLVMLVMWEKSVMDYQLLADTLELKTGTLTPIIQRLEDMELLARKKSDEDQRRTIVELLPKGVQMGAAVEQLRDDAGDVESILSADKHDNYVKVIDQLTQDLKDIEATYSATA